MSGHSKWHNIQARKGKQDAKKGKLFSMYSKKISIAAKSGADLSTNFSLRMLVEKAREVAMPKDNIDRAIKRGSGQDPDAAAIEEVTYEAYGPGGVAIMIKTLSDNRNRTVSELKHILSDHNGSMGGSGSVAWMFDQCGLVEIGTNNFTVTGMGREELEMALIDVGAEDIIEEDGVVSIKTKVENLQKVLARIKELGIATESAGLAWVPKDKVAVAEDVRTNLEKIFSELEENEDVEDYYTNAE